MNTFYIRTLRRDDACRLLEFEQKNRHWFEQHIEARGAAFYSPGGVQEHIDLFLEAHAQGRLHPCVIVDGDGTIIGRPNLKDIDQRAGIAEIGYRIAESHAGNGLATDAVRFLIELARREWQLKQLCAYVAHQNTASIRVLEKCSFTRREFFESVAVVEGVPVDGYGFSIDLDSIDC
jgi:ribosomal-protein-alanine N-acetyltransferase